MITLKFTTKKIDGVYHAIDLSGKDFGYIEDKNVKEGNELVKKWMKEAENGRAR